MMIYSNLAAAGKICKMDCDGQIWLSTYCSASNIQAHFAFMRGMLIPFCFPSLATFPQEEALVFL